VVNQAIGQRFPGAVIKEAAKIAWKGQMVTEVRLREPDGNEYEVVVANNGEILEVEQANELPVIGGELTIGAGLRVEKDIYMGADTEFQPAPFLQYHNDWFEITAFDDLSAAVKFLKTDYFSAAVKGRLGLDEGYNTDDSAYLKGMDELDTLYSAGLELEGNYAGFVATLGFFQDISGEHDGQEVELALGYPWAVAGFEFRPELSATWISDKTTDYLYGVSKQEARADRLAYSPGSSFEVEAELFIQREIYAGFSIITILEATMYGDAIYDSPIVDKKFSFEGAIGLAYTF
jgi:outer membrane protein